MWFTSNTRYARKWEHKIENVISRKARMFLNDII